MADKVLPQRVSMLGGGWLWVESVFPNHAMGEEGTRAAAETS